MVIFKDDTEKNGILNSGSFFFFLLFEPYLFVKMIVFLGQGGSCDKQ